MAAGTGLRSLKSSGNKSKLADAVHFIAAGMSLLSSSQSTHWVEQLHTLTRVHLL